MTQLSSCLYAIVNVLCSSLEHLYLITLQLTCQPKLQQNKSYLINNSRPMEIVNLLIIKVRPMKFVNYLINYLVKIYLLNIYQNTLTR